MTTATWRGYAYARGKKIWGGYKQGGEWKQRSTPFYIGQEAQAEALLARIREKATAG